MLIILLSYINLYKKIIFRFKVAEQKEGYEGIEEALREGWTLKVYSTSGVGFGLLSSSDKEESVRVQSYKGDFYVSEILRQLSVEYLELLEDEEELPELEGKKDSPLDKWVKYGNELFGRKDGENIRLEIRHGNQLIIPITPQPTFTQAYDILSQVEYSQKLAEYLDFIDQARKLLKL